MAKRLKTKIGDIFSIPISETEKKYMQLIVFDLLQLNSDVVRIFKKKYILEENPELESVIKDDILTYVHCSTDFGLKLNLWKKEGESIEVGNPYNIIFKTADDYGRKEGDEAIKTSHNWHIWKIGDEKFTKVERLKEEFRNAYVGLVINPLGIVEIAKGNKYPLNYPDFE